MPEGPEIRRAADRVEKALKDELIQAVDLLHPALVGHEPLFISHFVTRIDTRGKAMLIRLSSGWTVYSHNQLYGRWTVNPVSAIAASNRVLRLAITTNSHTARLWSATDINFFRSGEESSHPFIASLGPDVLNPESTPSILLDRLVSTSCRGRKAASLMLDQQAFAGLGNYLRSEILFVAGVHPDDRPMDLDQGRLEQWATNISRLSLRTYRTGGVTVDKNMADAGKASGRRRETWRHYVFNREGLDCPICSSTIVRKRYGGRRLDFCPKCQTPKRHL